MLNIQGRETIVPSSAGLASNLLPTGASTWPVLKPTAQSSSARSAPVDGFAGSRWGSSSLTLRPAQSSPYRPATCSLMQAAEFRSGGGW